MHKKRTNVCLVFGFCGFFLHAMFYGPALVFAGGLGVQDSVCDTIRKLLTQWGWRQFWYGGRGQCWYRGDGHFGGIFLAFPYMCRKWGCSRGKRHSWAVVSGTSSV